MNERLLTYLLGRVYRVSYGLLGLALGLLWATFGLRKALLISALALLGWLLGKWRDHGGPDASLRRLLRRWLEPR